MCMPKYVATKVTHTIALNKISIFLKMIIIFIIYGQSFSPPVSHTLNISTFYLVAFNLVTPKTPCFTRSAKMITTNITKAEPEIFGFY